MKEQNKTNGLKVSSDVVTYLQGQDMTLKDIGRLAGVSESYVSRVKKGERRFTIEHLLQIEQQLGKPLPLLLVESVEENSLNENMRPYYRRLRHALSKSQGLQSELKHTATRKAASGVRRHKRVSGHPGKEAANAGRQAAKSICH